MDSTDWSTGSKPMSSKELTTKAKQFEWNPRIGFKYWARAAETIHHEVCLASPANSLLLRLTLLSLTRVKYTYEKATFPRLI